jgi:hypothetical protein
MKPKLLPFLALALLALAGCATQPADVPIHFLHPPLIGAADAYVGALVIIPHKGPAVFN